MAGYPPDKASFRRQFERDKDALRELGLPLRIGHRVRGKAQSHVHLRDLHVDADRGDRGDGNQGERGDR